MRVAILQDDFPPRHAGGSGVIAHTLAVELKRQGHEVLVITAVRNVDDAGVSEVDGLTVHSLHSNYPTILTAWISLWNPQVVVRVEKILTEFNPDVVHAHNIHLHLSYASLKIAKRSGAKVFLTLHDAMSFHYGKLVECIDPASDTIKSYRVTAWQQMRKHGKLYNPFRNTVIRHYLKYADKMIAVSWALRDALKENGIERAEVIHNGIRVEEWQEDLVAIEAFRKKFNLEDKKVILFGGRLSAPKGGEQAVHMLARVVQQNPNTALLVVGKRNAYGEKMAELAQALGVENNLRFTGWLSGIELKAAYRASDVVTVLSTYLDPFPTINLEAMACGKPVVGTCFGGTKEAVVDGETGYIVNPFNILKLAEKVSLLLTDSTKKCRFGEAGYTRAIAVFDLNQTVKRIVGIYERTR